MFNNIEISEINKKQVVESSWILPVVLFLMGFCYFVNWAPEGKKEVEFIVSIMFGICFIFYGWPFWAAYLFICYLFEKWQIKSRTTEQTVIGIFLIESLLPAIIGVVLGFIDVEEFILGSLMLISSQFVRWIYLRRKGKMFNSIKKIAD